VIERGNAVTLAGALKLEESLLRHLLIVIEKK